MTTITPGAQYTARSEWREYEGGPSVDVSGLAITVKSLTDLSTVVGPTSTGVVHVATGLYVYVWAVPGDAAGDYALIWSGTDADEETVTSYELVSVTDSPATTVTLSDCIDYVESIAAGSLARLAVEVGDVTTYPQVQDALDAERDNQARRVVYPDVGSYSLNQALKRRVYRNLQMRGLVLAAVDPNTGAQSRPTGLDPEIRRLEGSFRRRTVG